MAHVRGGGGSTGGGGGSASWRTVFNSDLTGEATDATLWTHDSVYTAASGGLYMKLDDSPVQHDIDVLNGEGVRVLGTSTNSGDSFIELGTSAGYTLAAMVPEAVHATPFALCVNYRVAAATANEPEFLAYFRVDAAEGIGIGFQRHSGTSTLRRWPVRWNSSGTRTGTSVNTISAADLYSRLTIIKRGRWADCYHDDYAVSAFDANTLSDVSAHTGTGEPTFGDDFYEHGTDEDGIFTDLSTQKVALRFFQGATGCSAAQWDVRIRSIGLFAYY